MGAHNGKFFDVEQTIRFFDDIESGFASYLIAAEEHKHAMDDFHTTESWLGEDAMLGKKLVGEQEKSYLDGLIALHRDIVELQNEIIEKFKWDVDAAPNARIEYDVLEEINSFFRNKYMQYEAFTRRVEAEVRSLQMQYSKYGCISDVNFSEGRACFEALCGGDDDNRGFINECKNKFLRFDEEVLELMKQKQIIPRIDYYMAIMSPAFAKGESEIDIHGVE